MPDNDAPLTDEQRKNTIRKNTIADFFLMTADGLNRGALFGQIALDLLTELAKDIIYPITAGIAILRAIFAIRQATLEKEVARSTLLRVGVEIAAAVTVSVAVIGMIAAQALFAIVAPILFTAVLAAKSIYHLSVVFYSIYQWTQAKDQTTADKYSERARNNFVSFFASSIATVAVGAVMLAGKPVWAVCGIVAGLIAALYAPFAIKKAYLQIKASSAKKTLDQENTQTAETGNIETEQTAMMNNSKMHAVLEVGNQPYPNNSETEELLLGKNKDSALTNKSSNDVTYPSEHAKEEEKNRFTNMI